MKLTRHFGTALIVPTGQVFLKAILAAATYPQPAGKKPSALVRRRVLLRATYLYEACLLEHDLLALPPSLLAAAAALLALRRQFTGSVDSPSALLSRVELSVAGTAAIAAAAAGGSDGIGRRLRRRRPAPPPEPAAPAVADSVWTSRCEAVSGYREVELLETCAAIVAEVTHAPRSTAHGRILGAVKKKFSHFGRCLAVAIEAPLAVQHHITFTDTTTAASDPDNSEPATSHEANTGDISSRAQATRRRSPREGTAAAAVRALPAAQNNPTRNSRVARRQNPAAASPEAETQSTLRRSTRRHVA